MKLVRHNTKKHSAGEDFERLVAQESLILDVTEEICRALEATKINRQELARRLGKSKGFITQVLSGERNMTLRTAADLASALDHRLQVKAVPATRTIPAGSTPFYIPLFALHEHARSQQGASSHLGAVAGGWNEFARRAAQAQSKESPIRQERWSPATQPVECEDAEQASAPDHEFSLSA
jgi:transcriptional regulator with XRE-family HTH domain